MKYANSFANTWTPISLGNGAYNGFGCWQQTNRHCRSGKSEVRTKEKSARCVLVYYTPKKFSAKILILYTPPPPLSRTFLHQFPNRHARLGAENCVVLRNFGFCYALLRYGFCKSLIYKLCYLLQCYTRGMEVHQNEKTQQVHNKAKHFFNSILATHIYILVTL